jgi:hypothetical protein
VVVAQSRRKQLVDEYKRRPPEAGVYRIVNQRTGKALLGSALNLSSVRGKLDFARATNSPGALDHRLAKDASEYGIDAFTFEILEVLDVSPEMTSARIREDLDALEALWRERLSSTASY